jgi:hypothetical protein
MKTDKGIVAGICFMILSISLASLSVLNPNPVYFDRGIAFAQINAMLAIATFLVVIAQKLTDK